MERFLQHHSREHLKMAMLRQEETFKEQVNELHRLYRVQKMLMRDLKRQQNSVFSQNENENKTGSSQSYHAYSYRNRPPVEEHTDQESDIELTLAIGGSRLRKKQEVAVTSDSGGSHSSSSTESAGETMKLNEWGLFQTKDMSIRYPGKKSGFNMEEAMRKDGLKQPSWHLQCLSLKMT